MRTVAAVLLGSAAIDWPALVLDRAGVALLGLAAIALALPRPRAARGRLEQKPRGPAIFEGLGLEEQELDDAAARAVAAFGNGRQPS